MERSSGKRHHELTRDGSTQLNHSILRLWQLHEIGRNGIPEQPPLQITFNTR
jgi:hypothetical protein